MSEESAPLPVASAAGADQVHPDHLRKKAWTMALYVCRSHRLRRSVGRRGRRRGACECPGSAGPASLSSPGLATPAPPSSAWSAILSPEAPPTAESVPCCSAWQCSSLLSPSPR
jgi:hypothetical protein